MTAVVNLQNGCAQPDEWKHPWNQRVGPL